MAAPSNTARPQFGMKALFALVTLAAVVVWLVRGAPGAYLFAVYLAVGAVQIWTAWRIAQHGSPAGETEETVGASRESARWAQSACGVSLVMYAGTLVMLVAGQVHSLGVASLVCEGYAPLACANTPMLFASLLFNMASCATQKRPSHGPVSLLQALNFAHVLLVLLMTVTTLQNAKYYY